MPRRRQTAGLPSDQRLRPVVPTAATKVKSHERLAPGERLRELSEAHTSGLDFRLQISQPLYDRVRWIRPNKDRNNGKGRVARPKRKICVEEVHANGTWAADTRLRLAPDSKFFVLETQNCMTLITRYVPARVPAQAAKSRDQTRNTALEIDSHLLEKSNSAETWTLMTLQLFRGRHLESPVSHQPERAHSASDHARVCVKLCAEPLQIRHTETSAASTNRQR